MFTALRVTDRGVVFYDGHEARFSGDPAILEAFRAFARVVAPGCYTLTAAGSAVTSTSVAGSRLVEGMPTRNVVSPFAGATQLQAKRAPPHPYTAIRLEGVCTLLTNASGTEFLETCVASLVAWDGEAIVFPPLDRPRIDSVAEQYLRAVMPHRLAPLAVDSAWPLLAVNGMKGTCAIVVEGRDAFPDEVRRQLDLAFEASARRP